MTTNFDVPSDWFETFFTGPANRFWEAMVPPAATVADAAFIIRHLDISPLARIVDAPCGAGRHALALARRGFRVTGVDISEDALARAAEAAEAEQLPATFTRADMRRLPIDEPADGIISMGNSISYFDAEGTRALFANFAANLRPGGRLVIDTGCCAESVLPNHQAERTFEFDGGSYASVTFYDPLASVLKTRAELRLGEECHELRYAHRIVTTGELVRELDAAGLETLGLYRDVDDNEFVVGAPRLLLVARRR